jgi:hypothetical protein
MTTRRQFALASLALVALTLGALACAVPGLGPDPTPTLFVIPTLPPDVATQDPIETLIPDAVENIGQAPYFDPCNLVTEQEASAALGVPVVPEMFGIAKAFGSCAYQSQDFLQTVSVGALHDDDAKGLLSLGIAMGVLSSTPEVSQAANALMQNYEAMSVAEVLREVHTNPAWRAADAPAPEEVTGIGDVAFWTWYPDTMKGELAVGVAIDYVIVSIDGPEDQAAARAAAETLARSALTRLPTTPYSTLNIPIPTSTPAP